MMATLPGKFSISNDALGWLLFDPTGSCHPWAKYAESFLKQRNSELEKAEEDGKYDPSIDENNDDDDEEIVAFREYCIIRQAMPPNRKERRELARSVARVEFDDIDLKVTLPPLQIEREEKVIVSQPERVIPIYHQCLKCQDLWEYCSCQYENDEEFALMSDPESKNFKMALIEEEDWAQLFPEEEEPYEYTIESEVLGPVHEWGLPGGMRRRGRSKKRGGGRGKRRGAGTPRMVINRSPFWAPARLRTHLKFDLRFTAPSATIASPWSLEYIVLTNPNNFTGASTAVSGYASLAAMYRKNRVIKGSLVFSCQNNDAFGIEMFATPVNFLPSLTTDPTRFLNMQNSRRRLVSPKGGIDHGTVKASASIAQFGGSASTAVEDNYVGTTDNTSPPSDNLYFLYGHLTNGVATVVPALNVITVFVEIDFFELQSPAT